MIQTRKLMMMMMMMTTVVEMTRNLNTVITWSPQMKANRESKNNIP